jgi:hypothetical protein
VGEGACGTFGPDLTQVIQISVVVADSVAVTDTLHARAHALTAGGDTVPATFSWTSFDTTILAVADPMAGVFVGRKVGTTSLQAQTGDLPSNPIRITVIASTTP